MVLWRIDLRVSSPLCTELEHLIRLSLLPDVRILDTKVDTVNLTLWQQGIR